LHRHLPLRPGLRAPPTRLCSESQIRFRETDRSYPWIAILTESHSNWHYEIRITVDGIPSQVIPIRNGQALKKTDLQLVDLNGDGFLDIMIESGMDHRDKPCFKTFIYSQDTKQYQWIGLKAAADSKIKHADQVAIPDLFASSEYVFVGQVLAIRPFESVLIQQLTIIKAKEPPENVTFTLKLSEGATTIGSLKEGDQIVVFLKDRYFEDGRIWGTLTAEGSYALFPRRFVLPPEWILK